MKNALWTKAKIFVSILKIHLHNKDEKESWARVELNRSIVIIQKSLAKYFILEKWQAALQFKAIFQPTV